MNSKHKAFRLIVVFIMTAALIVPLTFSNLTPANAAVPEFNQWVGISLQPVPTEVRYVAVSSASSYDFYLKVTDPDTILEHPSVTVENPPPGLSVEQIFLGPIPTPEWKVSWDTSAFANDPHFTSQSFLITFVATDHSDPPETSPISIPFVVSKEDLLEPTITLDKDSYLAGDTAYLTIFDPREDSDGKNVASEAPLQSITAFKDNGDPIELWEVEPKDEPTVRSGTFRTSFVVSEPFGVTYPSPYSPVQTDPIEVSAVGIKTDREKYSTNASATIIAVTSGGNPPDDLLEVNGVAIPGATWVASPGYFHTNTSMSSPGENRVSVSIDGATYSTVAVVEDIAAAFVSSTASVNQNTLAERSWYYSNETAAVVVTNHQMNQNRSKAETISGLTVSTPLDTTNLVPMDLLETGVDTGIFTSVHLIGFTNDTNADPDRKLVKISPTPGESTILNLTYSDDLLSSGFIEDTATLTTSYPGESNEGIGGASGSPVAASSIVTVTNLSCGSHGGDAERDGICDGWEAPAKTYLTIPYGGSNHVFTYPCDPTCPNSSNDDILLEIDTLDGDGPSANVLPDIKTYFDQRGYYLHYRIDDDIPLEDEGSPAFPVLNVWSDNPSGENDCGTPVGTPYDSFREIKRNYFGEDSSERLFVDGTPAGCNEITNLNFKGAAKKQVWYYCLYGTTTKQKWSGGVADTSGLSEEIGNDCAVTLGAFQPVDQNEEKGTLMHELGHMFGLRHGGGVNSISANPLVWIADSNANCKPNYVSPMSYLHQFPNAVAGVSLDNWSPKYSNYALTHYDATGPTLNSPGVRLNETDGPNPNTGTIDIAWMKLGGGPFNADIASGALGSADDLDWDGDSGIDPLPAVVWNNNVNNFGFRDCNAETDDNAPNGVIRGFKDWNKLVLEMRVHGGSNWNVPGSFAESAEINNEVQMEIIQLGVHVLNNKFQLLNSSDFVDLQDVEKIANVGQDPDDIKEQVEEDLIGTSCADESCEPSVIQHIQKEEFLEAINRLADVSKLYDGDFGGDPHDDVIADPDARAALFNSTKGNNRVFTMELLEKDDGAFGMAWTNTPYHNSYAVILAESSNIKATDGRFFEHEKGSDGANNNKIAFTVKGEGPITLYLDRGLVGDDKLDERNTSVTVDGANAHPDFSDSDKGQFFGSRIDFTVPSANPGDQVHEVVIMGANVVPEFPATSALVLALMIVAIVVITTIAARGKNGFISSFHGR